MKIAFVYDHIVINTVETASIPEARDLLQDPINLEVWEVVRVDTQTKPITAEVRVKPLSELEAIIEEAKVRQSAGLPSLKPVTIYAPPGCFPREKRPRVH